MGSGEQEAQKSGSSLLVCPAVSIRAVKESGIL